MVCRKPAAPGPVPQGLADECAPLELVREYRLGGRLVGEVVSAQVGRELIRRRPGRGRRGVLGLSVPGLRPTSASTVSTRRTSSVDPVKAITGEREGRAGCKRVVQADDRSGGRSREQCSWLNLFQ